MMKIAKRHPIAKFALSLLAGLVLACPVHSNTLQLGCTGCHGPDGSSAGEYMPSIAGLNFQYFYATMQAYKKDRKKSSVMGRIAKGYKTSQLQHLALFYGLKPWTGQEQQADLELAKRGAALHLENCEECHEQNGHFQDKETPPLAGQSKGYLLFQMTDYRQAATIMPQPPLMQERLEKLDDDELKALSEFYASELAKRPSAESVQVD